MRYDRYHKPTRMAYQSNLANSPSNFNFVSLFNDSNSVWVLAVHDIFTLADNNATLQALQVGSSKLGGSPNQGIALITGQGAMPGQVLQGTVVALPTTGLFNWNSGLSGWFHNYPIAVLRPGWAITAYSSASSVSMHLGFFWEALTPTELQHLYPEYLPGEQ